MRYVIGFGRANRARLGALSRGPLYAVISPNRRPGVPVCRDLLLCTGHEVHHMRMRSGNGGPTFLRNRARPASVGNCWALTAFRYQTTISICNLPDPSHVPPSRSVRRVHPHCTVTSDEDRRATVVPGIASGMLLATWIVLLIARVIDRARDGRLRVR